VERVTVPNLHDRRAIDEIVARMDTEAIVERVRSGELSAFAVEVAAEELARRVVADAVDYGWRAHGRASRVLDRAGSVVVTLGYLFSLAWVLGLVR
jgi:hypothetical protein